MSRPIVAKQPFLSKTDAFIKKASSLTNGRITSAAVMTAAAPIFILLATVETCLYPFSNVQYATEEDLNFGLSCVCATITVALSFFSPRAALGTATLGAYLAWRK